MRLLDLPRTSGFRLALVFLALFGSASTILFGFLYVHTQHFLIARVDDWLRRESPGVFQVPPAQLAERIAERAARNSTTGNVFLLLNADGTRLTGSSLAEQVEISSFDKPLDLRLGTGAEAGVRGIAHRLTDGRIVVVGQGLHELSEFNEDFVNMALSGAALTTALGLLGALLVGISTTRRFDALTTAIERIVSGDLTSRLPAGGSSGDLDRLTRVVNAMLDDLERLMHEVKGVCDGIAHDLRTPLTRLLAGLERARRRPGQAVEQERALDEAIAQVGAILQTFTSLLRIAEVEDGARRTGFVPVSLPEVAADVVDFYDPLADAKNISLTLSCPDTRLQLLDGDPSLLFEALANLVDNGIKFAPPGGTVTLEVRHQGGRPVLSVLDNGPGIAAAERDAVLRRFYRGADGRSTEGNGLGLSLVAAVARLHRLTLEIGDAQPGCRVTLTADRRA